MTAGTELADVTGARGAAPGAARVDRGAADFAFGAGTVLPLAAEGGTIGGPTWAED